MERKATAPILIFGSTALCVRIAGIIGKSLQAGMFVDIACLLEALLTAGTGCNNCMTAASTANTLPKSGC